MVLEVDPEKRRICLGLKQTMRNPWEAFTERHPLGSEVEGEIKNITEFGLFVGLDNDIDGMVHLSDLDWEQSGEEAVKRYSKGDTVRAQVLDVDVEKERISLGIKQLGEDPFRQAIAGLKRGDRVTCTVTRGHAPGCRGRDRGRRARASSARPSWRATATSSGPERFAKGEKVDAKVTNVDAVSRRLVLSVKALEIEDEKQAMADYGSSDSGASLGDILGAAIRQKQEEQSKG